MDSLLPLWQVIAIGCGAVLVCAFAMTLYFHKQVAELRQCNAALTASIAAERQGCQNTIAALSQARAQLSETFNSLAGQALQNNNDVFLSLARENLQQFQIQAESQWTQREKSIEGLVNPIKEAMAKTEQEIRRMENERKQAYGSLHQHIEGMAQTQQQLHTETRNLVQALRRPEVRGRWGEMTLKRLVELAGMVEHCDFAQQVQQSSVEGGTIRPDMVVHLPAGRDIVVDVKTPLDAYLSALEASDEQTKTAQMLKHSRAVRARVKELASKAYWRQFTRAPDFVILFIPGEQFLSAALDIDPQLLEYALGEKIILTTPGSFIAVLRAVAFGWRQQQLSDNAQSIRRTGAQLYKRLTNFNEHLGKIGKALDQAAVAYNKGLGTFQRQVLPCSKKLSELGVGERQTIEPGEPVATSKPVLLDQDSE